MKVVILGGGESGIGAALLAREKGEEVFVSDKGSIKPHYKEELITAGIDFEEGTHDYERILECDLVIKSPGIPERVPLVQELLQKGIPVISEIEFAGRYTDLPIVGITGSNGKTTTTSLLHHILITAGRKALLGGNVGVSFARNVLKQGYELHVLELSSFQLDGIRDFRPNISMILNITPDHLDRYDNRMELYIESKFRITTNMQEADLFLYNEDDPNVRNTLSKKNIIARTMAIQQKMIDGPVLTIAGRQFDLGATALQGRHNAMNALFAIAAALELGVGTESIQEGLKTFRSVPHRLERVGWIDGVVYINDSKATNVDAAYFGLDAMPGPIIWIAGGQDKGNDYAPLIPLVQERVKGIICLGKDNRKLLSVFGDKVPKMAEVDSAKKAVDLAREWAETGDQVLLSPACASFDLFKNYEDRGDQFREAVQRL